MTRFVPRQISIFGQMRMFASLLMLILTLLSSLERDRDEEIESKKWFQKAEKGQTAHILFPSSGVLVPGQLSIHTDPEIDINNHG